MNPVVDDNLAEVLDGIEDPALRRLMRAWDAARRGRALPAPGDLPMDDIAPFATDCLEISVHRAPGGAARFRYETVGENFTRRFGAGLVGHHVDELAETSAYFAHVQASLSAALAGGAPRVERHQLLTDAGALYAYEALQLPLAGDRARIDRFLVCCRLRPQDLPALPA
jgi:hypothetical protein